ncbi:MAG: hypothetical protein V1653_02900 [bacterium]
MLSKWLSEWQPIASSIMLILISIFVLFLVNWVRSIYKSLETKGISPEPKDLKNYFKPVNSRIDDIQSIINGLEKELKEINGKYGDYATHVVSVEKSIDTEKKKMENIQKAVEEKLKNVSSVAGGSAAVPEVSKRLLNELKEKLDYILDNFKVHDDQLVNIQKIVSKNREDLDNLKTAFAKISKNDIEKVYETISQDKNLIAQLSERTDTMQNKITGHSEQIEILQKIFEDIDADLVEMDKYFKSLSKPH